MKKRTTVIQLDDSEDNFIRMGRVFLSSQIILSYVSPSSFLLLQLLCYSPKETLRMHAANLRNTFVDTKNVKERILF